MPYPLCSLKLGLDHFKQRLVCYFNFTIGLWVCWGRVVVLHPQFLAEVWKCIIVELFPSFGWKIMGVVQLSPKVIVKTSSSSVKGLYCMNDSPFSSIVGVSNDEILASQLASMFYSPETCMNLSFRFCPT